MHNGFANPTAGTLVGLTKRIRTICILIDNGVVAVDYRFVDANEEEMLRNFWSRIRRDDVIIGGHFIETEWALICQRTSLHLSEVEFPTHYSHEFFRVDRSTVRKVNDDSSAFSCVAQVRDLYLVFSNSDDGGTT